MPIEKIDISAAALYNAGTGYLLRKNQNPNANHRINFLQLGLGAHYNFMKNN